MYKSEHRLTDDMIILLTDPSHSPFYPRGTLTVGISERLFYSQVSDKASMCPLSLSH